MGNYVLGITIGYKIIVLNNHDINKFFYITNKNKVKDIRKGKKNFHPQGRVN